MSEFLAHLVQVLRHDRALFARFPKLRYAVIGALFVPAAYAFIYLSSVWDPNARTAALPVALVQEDQGFVYHEQKINMGEELLASLEAQKAFHYIHYPDGESARRAVRQGEMVFALIIPRDFSLHAVPGNEAGGGKLVIYTSEGNSYNGAGFAKRFAPELAHQVNENLNEKRWTLVLERAAGSARSLDTLRDATKLLKEASIEVAEGSRRASQGSGELAAGLDKIAPAGVQLADGVKQMNGGLRQMQSRIPGDEALLQLRSGASGMAKNAGELADGLDKLHAGSGKLSAASSELKSQSEGIPFIGDKLERAADELASGAEQLRDGLARARDGQHQLAEGARRLDSGVGALTEGVSQIGSGLSTMTSRLPPERQLTKWTSGLEESARAAKTLAGGLAQLEDGTARLQTGLILVSDSLPRENPAMEGNPKGLAISVQPELEIVAPVANNGTGFAVNFVPLALWVGAVICAFLFPLRQIPNSLAATPTAALILGKLVYPALMSLAQALIMLLMLTFVLNIAIPSTLAFALTLICASLTFLGIIFALIRLFGDTGKILSVFFLILQLSSAGALMPVELTSTAFQILHPLLPFTWVVKAFRASLFGAYDGAWLFPWSVAICGGIFSVVLAAFFGRWKIVADENYRPATDVIDN